MDILKSLFYLVLLSLGGQHGSTYDDDAIVFKDGLVHDDNDVRFIEKPEKALSFRNGYKYLESTSMFYKEHRLRATWQDAVNKCQAEGAELTLPKSRIEVHALKTQFRPMTDKIWLGLHDPAGNGNLQALDATRANISNLFIRVLQSAAPEFGGSYGKCGTMNKNKHYENSSCDLKLRFICSKRRSALQYNPNCGPYKGYFLKSKALSCFKIHTEHKNWIEASKMCKKEQASLATVDSLDEMNLYVETMEGHPGNKKGSNYDNDIFWLGFSDHTGVLETVQGEVLTGQDIRWARRPSEDAGNTHCGSLLRDGRHEVNNCGTMAMFFCEKSLTALNLNVDER